MNTHARIVDGQIVELGPPVSSERPAFDDEGQPIFVPEEVDGQVVYPEREDGSPDYAAGPVMSDRQAMHPVSNYDALSDEELAEDGWVPIGGDEEPEVDPALGYVSEQVVALDGAGLPVASWPIVAYPAKWEIDRDTIPADGQTPAVVRVTHLSLEGEVELSVNGLLTTVEVVDHTAEFEVVASELGPIFIAGDGLGAVTIAAEEA